MPEPSKVSVRAPAFAGTFYPADPERCREMARRLVRGAALAGDAQLASASSFFSHRDRAPGDVSAKEVGKEVAKPAIGGIVPHAGWICSGAVAGQTISELTGPFDLIVIFGAVHSPRRAPQALLDSYAVWETPVERSSVASEVRGALAEARGFCIDDSFHQHEHAIEVELPLITAAFASVSILPIEVPVLDDAPAIGVAVARRMSREGLRAAFLASSDLTHYGPAYDFVPAGVGLAGLAWAKDNDARLLECVLTMDAERIVPEARENLNACGPGAIAAMLAACRESGATMASVLRQTSSFETLGEMGNRFGPQSPDDAVGYASVVVR